MPKLLLCCGVSGSGKSTYAKELVSQGWGEVNRDEWRFKLFTNGEKDWSKYKFTKEREKLVTEYCNSTFDGWVSLGANIVVSNTNLNQIDHNYWRAKAEEVGYDFEVKYFPILLEEALKRDQKRGALSVGREVLFKQWQKWLEITNYKRYVPDTSKPKVFIVDIDGTIALTNGRSHYDFSEKVTTDKLRQDVMEMIESFCYTKDASIILLSGRDDICRQDTINWLNFWRVDYLELHMRKNGDNRSDRLIKEEIFWEHIEPRFNVLAAFDDRPRIVRLWKDIGIPLVVDVCKTYEEF